MPYIGEHAARINEPDKYKRIRRINNRFGKGIHVLFGFSKGGGSSQVQAIRFDSSMFTVAAAKKWLKDHNFKAISFEPALPKKKENDDMEQEDIQDNRPAPILETENDEDYESDIDEINSLFPADNYSDDEKSGDNLEIEHKVFAFNVTETKIEKSGDNEIGVFVGSMATEHTDRGGDIIAPEAFDKTLARYKKQGRRIRLYYQHNPNNVPIGGINPKNVTKEGKNWNIKGELDFGVQQAREVYSALKNKNLSDLSIGFTIEDADWEGKTRLIKDLELWEVSIVGEPMNPKATINEVKDFKGATSFKDLPLADRGMAWSKREAIQRVREKTGSTDKPSATYRNAFFWFDNENADNFTAYKLPFADVVGGQLKAVPRAIFAAAVVLRGGRGGVDIPDADKQKVISHVNKYYDKMGLTSPLKSKSVEYLLTFDDELKEINNYDVEDVEHVVTQKSFEDLLKNSGCFSRQAATYLAKFFNPQKQSESVSSIDSKQSESVDDEDKSELILEKLNELKCLINKFAEI